MNESCVLIWSDWSYSDVVFDVILSANIVSLGVTADTLRLNWLSLDVWQYLSQGLWGSDREPYWIITCGDDSKLKLSKVCIFLDGI